MKTVRMGANQSKVLSWILAAASLLIAAVSLSLHALFEGQVPFGWEIVLGFVSAIVIIGAGYIIAERILRLREEKADLHAQLLESEEINAQSRKRLDAVFRINQRFADATSEDEIIDVILQSSVELAGAVGALFVPLDERGQPAASVGYGEDPYPIPEAMVEYLASPGVRDRCRSCSKDTPLADDCPLIKGPFGNSKGLYCLTLARGEREYGVLNLHFPIPQEIDPETRKFLKSMADQTALALESFRLRKRELATLSQLNAVRRKTDVKGQFNGLLENLRQALDADFVIIYLQKSSGFLDRLDREDGSTVEMMACGNYQEKTTPIIQGLLEGVVKSGEPVILNNAAVNAARSRSASGGISMKSIIAAPLFEGVGNSVGVLLAGSRRSQNFHTRQLVILENIASQIGLDLQIYKQIADMRYQTMIEERTRLAREIHDGLAQTLGFLKLQMSQMKGYLEKNELSRLRAAIETGYQAVSEAYQEARYAIDGLRITADEEGHGWLRVIVDEFRENLRGEGIEIELAADNVQKDLEPEIQAELIRILQEALSNVRKHAEASKVWVSYCEGDGEITLEIHDNGRGFDSEDVVSPSRHGLRGMRERAELIGAEFQVISKPQNGTAVRVRLPLEHGELVK